MPEIIERTLGWDRDQVVRGQSPGAKDISIAFRDHGDFRVCQRAVSHPANTSSLVGS